MPSEERLSSRGPDDTCPPVRVPGCGVRFLPDAKSAFVGMRENHPLTERRADLS